MPAISIIFLLAIIWLAWTFKILSPLSYLPQPLLFSDLVSNPVTLHSWLVIVCGVLNVLLIWLISKRLFNSPYTLLPPLIYGTSPWFSYLAITGSFYIYLLTMILILINGLLSSRDGDKKLAQATIIISSVLIIYSSFYGLLVLTVLAWLKINQSYLFLILLLSAPLMIMAVKNPEGLQNITSQQVSIFTDPGLRNSYTTLIGENNQSGYSKLSKISENRFIYIAKYTLNKTVKQLMPGVYFTPQERLLNFSFSPPLYLAFLIPFLTGLYQIALDKNRRKYLFISLLLIIPSLLSSKIVDINRLHLFSPVIIFIIVFGITVISKIKTPVRVLLTSLIIFLLLVQLGYILYDMSKRERPRHDRYFNPSSLIIDKQ